MNKSLHCQPVVTLIKGGLGNQMFCYAAGRALSHRLGRSLLLDTRTGFRRDQYERQYRLGHLPIRAEEADEKQSLGGDTRSFPHKLARTLSRISPLERRFYLAESPRLSPERFIRVQPSRRRSVYLNGYWQDERYFEAIADLLRMELTPPAPTGEKAKAARVRLLAAPAPVMVHVRRNHYSPRLGADYYTAAAAACLEALPQATFHVFGDDVAWAKKWIDFAGAPIEFLDRVGADELDDLHLMTCCRHAIVANSSFSWWGAWLGEQAGRKVWTPAVPGWPVRPAAGWIPIENSLER